MVSLIISLWNLVHLFNSGKHIIRPTDQMRPAKSLNLAREAQNLVNLACFFHKKHPFISKNISFLAFEHEKNTKSMVLNFFAQSTPIVLSWSLGTPRMSKWTTIKPKTGYKLSYVKVRGPPRPSQRTPSGFTDPRLRTYWCK